MPATWSRSPISPGTSRAVPPDARISSPSDLTKLSFRALTATAYSFANRRTSDAPSPGPAPVKNATRDGFEFPMIILRYVYRRSRAGRYRVDDPTQDSDDSGLSSPRPSTKDSPRRKAMMKLYHYRNNIWTVCVRLVLAEKGLDYEMVNVDLFAGEHLKPEFVALNPYHKVPLLEDGGVAVPESWIINEYLEDHYPSPPLLPRDARDRARARVIVDYANRFFFPHVYDLLIELVVKPRIPAMGEPSPGAVTKSKEALPAAFERLERELGGREFFAGDFSIVDCEIIPFVAGLADADMAIPA